VTPTIQSRLGKSFESRFPVDKIRPGFVITEKTLTRYEKRNRHRGRTDAPGVKPELRIGSEPSYHKPREECQVRKQGELRTFDFSLS
jgi:hypothetical protein